MAFLNKIKKIYLTSLGALPHEFKIKGKASKICNLIIQVVSYRDKGKFSKAINKINKFVIDKQNAKSFTGWC